LVHWIGTEYRKVNGRSFKDICEYVKEWLRSYEMQSPAPTVDETQKCDQQEPDIDYHLKRINAIQATLFDKAKGRLMAEVFLRRTGAINDHNGNYTVNSKDLFTWFENLDYLREYTEYDKM
jgi:vesicle coat complex subunit